MRRLLAGFALVVISALVLFGGRGVAKWESSDAYFNCVKKTTTGMVRFHADTSGASSSPDSTERVYYVEAHNATADSVVVAVLGPQAFGTPPTASVRAYIPAGTIRVLASGFAVDSINVIHAPDISGKAIYFYAYGGRR